MTAPRYRAEMQIQTVCLIIIAAFALGTGLYLLRPVLVPFILAIFFAFMLSPLLDFQVQRLRIPRYLALVVTLLLGFLVLSTVGGLVASNVRDLASRSEEIQSVIETRLESMIEWGGDMVPLERLGIDPDEDLDVSAFLPEDIATEVFRRATGTILGILSQVILVMLFVLFLLLGRAGHKKPLKGVAAEIESSVKRYINAKVVLSAFTGFAVFLILNFIGIPYAIAFGAFAFMFNFIPSVGSIIATFLPLPVLLLMPELSTLKIVLALALPGALQFSVGNIIEPKIMGDSLDLHPVVILLALIFWGMLWGPIGMLLAAPLTAIAKITLSKTEITAPIASALAGRLDELERDAE